MIRIFVTGGTFDKQYDEINGRLAFKDSQLPDMLRLGRCKVDVTIRTVMLVDSLDMTDADRELIAQNCQQAPRMLRWTATLASMMSTLRSPVTLFLRR